MLASAAAASSRAVASRRAASAASRLRLRLAALIERDEPDDQRHHERHGDRRELGAQSAVRSGLAIDAFLRLEFLAGAERSAGVEEFRLRRRHR